MREFMSFLAPNIYAFISFRKAADRWNDTYEIQLSLFDKYCRQQYSDSVKLSQEMVDNWCQKRSTENNNSCRSRINAVVCFIQYLQSRKLTNVTQPSLPREEAMTYIPHAFTQAELESFFKACDEISKKSTALSMVLNRLTVPVFFRLLYSSGIRTTEARLLRRLDVDLIHGVLNIRYSKGHNQHFVVMHDTMLELMKKYDEKIEKLYPNRIFFFPDRHDSFRPKWWVRENFLKMWSKYNSSRAIAYELRHNYAVENINSWTDEGFGFDAKLLCLSKSMGHASTESTKYYYSLVPGLADIIASKSSDDSIIPEVDYESH